jgi:hypothetical protein
VEETLNNPLFKQAIAYYEANKPAIREKYPGKQIVISGGNILGVYDDVGTAYRETVKTTPLGSFIIQDIPVNIEDDIIYLSPFLSVAHV